MHCRRMEGEACFEGGATGPIVKVEVAQRPVRPLIALLQGSTWIRTPDRLPLPCTIGFPSGP